MAEPYTHKQGDSFDILVTIPESFTNGYFVGHTVASQVRQVGGDTAKIADLTATWVDPLTTRSLRLKCLNTTAWPTGPAQFDVEFTRTSDSFVFSSTTAVIFITPDVTR